jgi:hypothetical protein
LVRVTGSGWQQDQSRDPAGRELRLIVDNYATHKHPRVRGWLERHTPFTPTSASWLNAVERFFAKLTRQRLKRGVFKGHCRSPGREQSLSRRNQCQPQALHLDR